MVPAGPRRLAELDLAYKGHAHALLTAFIRRHAPWPALPDREPGLADDVAAALAVLGRGTVIEPGDGSELERVDLRGANLTGATLADAILRNADLRGADLTDAELTGADLTGVLTDDTTRWPRDFTPPG